jgi:hypothetical protein
MNAFVKKLQRIEQRISAQQGPFDLFAALRPESDLRLWDLLVAAQWLDHWSLKQTRIIAAQLAREFPLPEMVKFSRIAVIERDNPGLRQLHSAVQLEHGVHEFKNVIWFDAKILHAYVITCRQVEAKEVSPQYAA